MGFLRILYILFIKKERHLKAKEFRQSLNVETWKLYLSFVCITKYKINTNQNVSSFSFNIEHQRSL